jgi:prepilin-type N-terminal cleavage/methylation domain-containing protein/prepilin-type processing-associated H-X9-DG protein
VTNRRGFTLIELLVVVAIIALLISILLPSLKQAREQTKGVVCGAHLSELAKGLSYYLEENRHFPGGHLQHQHGPYFAAWIPRIFKYLNNERGVWYCPSAEGEAQFERLPARWMGTELSFKSHVEALGYELGDAPFKNGSQRVYEGGPTRKSFSYGYNESGNAPANAWSRDPQLGLGVHVANWQPYSLTERHIWELKESKVVKPDDMIVIADSDADEVEDTWISPSESNKWPGDRHNLGANVLFADLHVQRIPRQRIVRLDDNEQRRWNNDHEPHRELWPSP